MLPSEAARPTVFLDGLRGMATNVSRLMSVAPVERYSSVFGLTAKTARLVIQSSDDSGLEMQDMIQWE